MEEPNIIKDTIELTFVDLVFMLNKEKKLGKNQSLFHVLVDNNSGILYLSVTENLSALPRVFSYEQEQVLKTKKLTDLNVTLSIKKFLMEKVRIATLRELVQLRETDLMKYRYFGKLSLGKVITALAELGLALRK